jgi:hypothetical protein
MLINLDTVPVAALIGADTLAWITFALGIASLMPRQRWRVLPAILLGIVLLDITTAIQGIHFRTVILMSFTAACGIAIGIFVFRVCIKACC